MKSYLFSRIFIFLIGALVLISLPNGLPTAEANTLRIDFQISSTGGESWYSPKLPFQVPVNTLLFYRVTAPSLTLTYPTITFTSSLSQGAVISGTVKTEPYVFSFNNAFSALLGNHTEIVTATYEASPLHVVTDTVSYTGVPEPVTILLVGSGLIGVAGLRRKLKK